MLLIAAATLWVTTLSGRTSLVTICAMLFVMGLGLGPVTRVVVPVAQNAVPPCDLGTATSTHDWRGSRCPTSPAWSPAARW